MQFGIQSPFANMSQQMYSPSQTASAGSQALAAIGQQGNVMSHMKQQPLNRGIGRNVYAGMAGQGGHDARRQFAPMSMALRDGISNAQYGLGIQGANESAGLMGLGHAMQGSLRNQQWQTQMIPYQSQLLSQLLGGGF
jgi:hypothetical protein